MFERLVKSVKLVKAVRLLGSDKFRPVLSGNKRLQFAATSPLNVEVVFDSCAKAGKPINSDPAAPKAARSSSRTLK